MAAKEEQCKEQNELSLTMAKARSILRNDTVHEDKELPKVFLSMVHMYQRTLPMVQLLSSCKDSDTSVLLDALARLIESSCEVYEHLMLDTFPILRKIIVTAMSMGEKRGDAAYISSLERLLIVVISHSQKPCRCTGGDVFKWVFYSQVLTIPFVLRYFRHLKEVFTRDPLWIQYIHKLGLCLQASVDVLPYNSWGWPSQACLLDNLLKITWISLSNDSCFFDMTMDFTNVLSLLLEKSMGVTDGYYRDLKKDIVGTITMDDELSIEISKKIDSSFVYNMVAALSFAPEDKLLAAGTRLSSFLYSAFHSFIDKECRKKILSELVGTTQIVRILCQCLKVTGIGDSPQVLVVFSMLYHHMLLEIDVKEFYEKEKPFKLEDVKNIISILKKAVWKLLWVVPENASDPVTVSDQEDHDSKNSKPKDYDMEASNDPEILLEVAKHRACIRVSELLRELLEWNNLRPYTLPGDFYMEIDEDVEKLFLSKARPRDERVKRVLTLAPFLVSFTIRLKIFSAKIAAKRQPYHTKRFPIHRHRLLEDAVDLFRFQLPERKLLRHKIAIRFLDQHEEEEGGVDLGGLFKEFMGKAATTAFSANHGLFTENCNGLLYPYHKSQSKHKETSNWFFFLGAVLGKALFDDVPIDIQFAPFFLRKLISQRRTWYPKDLLGLDPVVYNNLNKLKEFSEDEISESQLDFSIDENDTCVSLAKDGKHKVVTSHNVLDYIAALSSHRLDKEAEYQTRCFLSSFHQVIPKDWISIFDEREIQLLISGLPKAVNVEYLRKNCIYRGDYSKEHQEEHQDIKDYIMSFWEVLQGFTQANLTTFLTFVTGLPLVKYPRTGNPETVFEIHSLWGDGFPTSSTCHNILRLPRYISQEVLRTKLLEAIYGSAGFWDG